MADINDLIGYAECGGENVRGYNVSKGCETPYGITSSLFAFDPSVKLTGELNKKMFTDFQKEGKLDIIKGVLSSAEVGTDTIYETLDSGQDLRAGDPVYRTDYTFAKGEYFNKAITYLAGQTRRIVEVDRNGNMRLAENSGSVQGFETSLIDVNKQVFQSDTAGAKQSLKIQYASSKEYTQRATVIGYDEDMDFNPATLEDKTQAYIKFPPEVKAGDSFTFSLVVDRGRSTPIIGMDGAGAFTVTINGVAKDVTATDVDGLYTVSEAVAENDVLKVKIKKVQEDADLALYCSSEFSTVVVA